MYVIRTLQRTPDRDAPLRVVGGDHSVVFYVKLLLGAGRVFAFDDVFGFRPDAVDIAFFNSIGFENVVRAPNDWGAALAFFDREYSGKEIVFYRDGVNRFPQGVAIRVGQQQNRFLRVVYEFT